MANLGLNLQQFAFQKSFEPMPPGWYPAVITASEIVPTQANDGFRLKLSFEIIDGPHKGRKVEEGFNIQNKSDKAVEISMEALKTLSACLGIFATLQDSVQLHNQPLQIRLAKKTDSDFNEVKGYKTINGDDPGKAGQPAPQQHVQQPQQGFAQPPVAPQQQPYGQPPAPPAGYIAPAAAPSYGAPQQPAYAPQPPAQAAPPAWAPPTAPAAPQAPQAPQQQAYQQPAAPAWAPNPAPPQAPSWSPNR